MSERAGGRKRSGISRAGGGLAAQVDADPRCIGTPWLESTRSPVWFLVA